MERAAEGRPARTAMNNLQGESHIKIYSAAERRYWCDQLGCTEGMLHALVVNVGTNEEDVRRAAYSGCSEGGAVSRRAPRAIDAMRSDLDDIRRDPPAFVQ